MKDQIQNYFQGNFKPLYDKYLPAIKKIGGSEYQAICPFHEDTHPSFNFNSQTGAYYCHGCGKKGGAFHFYGKLHGLDTRSDFPKILKGIANDFGIAVEQQKRRLVSTYDYRDIQGELVFQVCRMDPKSFYQRHSNGNGGWVNNLKGIKPILYRLPQLTKADEVVIVEGEKDADNLTKLGFTATTNAMGAKKWDASYTDALKGKHIVLIPDNDNEGREHMTRVASAINGHAASIKLLTLPDLPSKGDVTDYISRFKDKEEASERLAVMIDGAEPYKPLKVATLEDVILPVGQYCKSDLPVKNSILHPWLSEQSIGLINGWRGVGKSWFAMSLLNSVSKGESFGPWETKTQTACLYLEGEMPAQDIGERFNVLNPDHDDTHLYIYSDAYANHLGLPKANLLSNKWRSNIRSILLTRKIKLWVVDNLASLTPGIDENSKKDWDPINEWLLELRFAGISTILLHHTNKAGSQRGTSAREDNIDYSIILKHPPNYLPEDGASFIVNFNKARVKTVDLKLIADIHFRLMEDESGSLVWNHGNVKMEIKKEVIRMLDDDASYSEIIDALGITKGRVSQIKSKAIKDGLLTNKCKLTQSGFSVLASG